MMKLSGRWVPYLAVAITGVVVMLSWLGAAERQDQFALRSLQAPHSDESSLLPTPSVKPTHQSQPTLKNLTKLSSAKTTSEATSAWRASRIEILNKKDSARAVSDLVTELASGENHVLDTTLRVSVGGELLLAPTTRVYMLDLLALLDSAEAAEYSRTILEKSTDSDEWAIALRNYAWGVDNAAFDPFLRQKVYELLTNQAWITQPTSGFLEAFDFVPFTQDPTLVAPLMTLTKPEQPANVRRAAFLALARLFAQNSTAGLQGVSEAAAAEPFSPVRADAMSRANFTRPQDVDMVRSYLLSNTIDPAEFALFADTFPQGGQFAGPALATTFQPEPFSTLAKRDARALSIIQGWMGDSALEPRRGELSQIYERLVRLTDSAAAGGYL